MYSPLRFLLATLPRRTIHFQTIPSSTRQLPAQHIKHKCLELIKLQKNTRSRGNNHQINLILLDLRSRVGQCNLMDISQIIYSLFKYQQKHQTTRKDHSLLQLTQDLNQQFSTLLLSHDTPHPTTLFMMIYGNQSAHHIDPSLWNTLLSLFFSQLSLQSSANIALVAQAMHHHDPHGPYEEHWLSMAHHFLAHPHTYHTKYKLIMLWHLRLNHHLLQHMFHQPLDLLITQELNHVLFQMGQEKDENIKKELAQHCMAYVTQHTRHSTYTHPTLQLAIKQVVVTTMAYIMPMGLNEHQVILEYLRDNQVDLSQHEFNQLCGNDSGVEQPMGSNMFLDQVSLLIVTLIQLHRHNHLQEHSRLVAMVESFMRLQLRVGNKYKFFELGQHMAIGQYYPAYLDPRLISLWQHNYLENILKQNGDRQFLYSAKQYLHHLALFPLKKTILQATKNKIDNSDMSQIDKQLVYNMIDKW